MNRWCRRATTAAALAIIGCADTHDLPLPAGAFVVEDTALSGLSGMEASVSQPGVLWAVNDGLYPARLYRLDARGTDLGRVALDGEWLWDPESLALLVDDDGHWLLVADVGDNDAIRRSVFVHAIAEPARDDTRAVIAWSIEFSYPDGPRDVEGVAVDPDTGDLLVFSKRDAPTRVYSVPLAGRDGPPVVARFVGVVDTPGGTVTGLAMSPDGRTLAALTYRQLHLWSRAAGQSWDDALRQPVRTRQLPMLPKAEGLSFSHDGKWLHIGSERLPTYLLNVRH